jgi:hypothetical protein
MYFSSRTYWTQFRGINIDCFARSAKGPCRAGRVAAGSLMCPGDGEVGAQRQVVRAVLVAADHVTGRADEAARVEDVVRAALLVRPQSVRYALSLLPFRDLRDPQSAARAGAEKAAGEGQ